MNRISEKNISILIHAGVWTGLFLMPYIVAYFTNTPIPKFDFGALLMPLQLMTLFYVNYLLLINKLLFKKRVWSFIGSNLLFVALVAVVFGYIYHNVLPEHMPKRPEFGRHPMPNIALGINIVIQLFVVGLSVAIKMTGKWYEARQRVNELEQINTQTELQQLKNQLNPHFLFNSLNNIYALITFNPEKAQLGLNSLCDMLRYQLYEANRETIPLEKEIEFMSSYCDLMRLRLPGHIALTVELPENAVGITIAPLLFVSIVENAFKHGISQNKKSHIDIKISVDSDTVECVVRNSYHPKTNKDRSGSGIGLENLRRRLELLYPDTSTFEAGRAGDEFVARLTITR